MNRFLHILIWVGILGVMIGCGGDSGGGGTDPQPTSVTLTTTAATFNGSTITPVPDFSITLNFDASGQPNGYSVMGTADKQPTVGSAGTFTVTGSQVTFSSGGTSRQVSITSGNITSNVTNISLQWDLTKVDDGVTADEQGTYVYTLSQ